MNKHVHAVCQDSPPIRLQQANPQMDIIHIANLLWYTQVPLVRLYCRRERSKRLDLSGLRQCRTNWKKKKTSGIEILLPQWFGLLGSVQRGYVLKGIEPPGGARFSALKGRGDAVHLCLQSSPFAYPQPPKKEKAST